MEHYLLCILNSSLSDRDHSLIKKYLGSLFPSLFQIDHIKEFNEPVSVLFKPISKYVVVLNPFATEENVVWKLLNDDENVLHILEEATTKTDSALEFSLQDGISYICESLHSLADQLPAFGTYKLDILLGSDFLKELSFGREHSLVAAFIRLTKWHSADFTIFEQQEFDSDRLNEWLEAIKGQILFSNRKFESGPSLWRGSIQFAPNNKKEKCRGFQLKMAVDKNAVDDSIPSVSQDPSQQHLEHIVMSSRFQLLEQVNFFSIPSYLITPVVFRLHLNMFNCLDADSMDFITHILNSKKAAFIATIGYSELKEKSKPERKYSSRAWERAASLGDVKDSECFVTSFEKFITFAITKSYYSDCIAAYLLRDFTTLDTNLYPTILNYRICHALHFLPEDKYKKDVLSDNVSKHKNIFHKYFKCNMDLNEGYCSCKGTDFSLLPEITTYCSSTSSQYDRNNLLKFSLEHLDPSDWPERIQLLQKLIQKEEKDGFSTNASVIQNLKLPFQSYSLSSETITKHFLPSGEGKYSENCENINVNSNCHYLVNCCLNDLLQMKWPEVMNCIYHDLYYNSSDQMEDKENLGSQLVNLYVQHETSCTCNNQQMVQNLQITVSERIQSPSKAFRGPSSRLAVISNERIEMSPSPRKDNIKELITKKILSTSALQIKNPDETRNMLRETSKRNSEETKKTLKEISKKHSLNKKFVPARSSPRKKNPVNYKYPSVIKNNENKNAESKLPELLKKKLRCAVAKALEENGIDGAHRLYQPCGAKLLTICRTFLNDLKLKKGKTSEYLQKIADAHVKQVIEFYKDS